jgi:hypothetical protein
MFILRLNHQVGAMKNIEQIVTDHLKGVSYGYLGEVVNFGIHHLTSDVLEGMVLLGVVVFSGFVLLYFSV